MTQLLRPDLLRVAHQIPPESRVLDLGCEDGQLLAYLMAQRSCTGTGADRDPASAVAAIRAGVPLIELNIDTQLGEFGDDSYDVVVLSKTLQFVLNTEDVLNQMARIGHRLIVSMPNFGYWKHRLRLLTGHMPRSKDLPYEWYDTPHLHHSTVLDLETLFDKLGLRVLTRIPLTETGATLHFGRTFPNLLASSMIYVLERS